MRFCSTLVIAISLSVDQAAGGSALDEQCRLRGSMMFAHCAVSIFS
jgi:hypothetical protein